MREFYKYLNYNKQTAMYIKPDEPEKPPVGGGGGQIPPPKSLNNG